MTDTAEIQSHAASILDRMRDNKYSPDPLLQSTGHGNYGDPVAAHLAPEAPPGIAAPTVDPQAPPEPPGAPPIDPQAAQAAAGGEAQSGRFGAGTTDPRSPYYIGEPDITPRDALMIHAKGVQGLLAGQKNVDQANLDAGAAEADAMKAGAAADGKARESYGNELFGSTERDRLAQNMYEQDRDKLLKEKQAAVKEQTDYANKMPTDLWGASGVNKIAGIIGLALGSLGGIATGGKNTALDAMNTLADDNIRRMKMHYDMLGDKVKGFDNTYAVLRQKLGDSHSAELSTRLVMNENFANQLQQAADSTVEPKAKAALLKTIAANAQQGQNLKAKIVELNGQQASHAASVSASVYATKAQHAEHVQSMNATAKEHGVDGEIFGFIAPDNPNHRLSKTATDKIRGEQRGVAQIKETVQDIKALVQSGNWDDLAVKNQAEAQLKLAILNANELSKRVSGSEGGLIDQVAGQLDVGKTGIVVSKMDPKLVLKLLNELDRTTTNAFAKGLVANGYKVDPSGAYADKTAEEGKESLGDRSGNAIGNIAARGAAPKTSNPVPEFRE